MPAIDWTAPSEVQNQTDAVLALVFAFLGVWAHESLLAFIRFDYQVLFAHRIQFKYTMLLYWANRLFAFLLLLSTVRSFFLFFSPFLSGFLFLFSFFPLKRC